MHPVFVDPPVPKNGLFHQPNTPGLGATMVEAELSERQVALTA